MHASRATSVAERSTARVAAAVRPRVPPVASGTRWVLPSSATAAEEAHAGNATAPAAGGASRPARRASSRSKELVDQREVIRVARSARTMGKKYLPQSTKARVEIPACTGFRDDFVGLEKAALCGGAVAERSGRCGRINKDEVRVMVTNRVQCRRSAWVGARLWFSGGRQQVAGRARLGMGSRVRVQGCEGFAMRYSGCRCRCARRRSHSAVEETAKAMVDETMRRRRARCNPALLAVPSSRIERRARLSEPPGVRASNADFNGRSFP